MMKVTRTRGIAAILIVVMFAVAMMLVAMWELPRPRLIVIEITGVEDQQVAVKLDVDGELLATTNTIPARVSIEAHRLSWEVATVNSPEGGRFRVSLRVDGREPANGSAEGDRILAGGYVGADGFRSQRAWHGRFEE